MYVQIGRNADHKSIAFYAFNETWYESDAYFWKLDLGSQPGQEKAKINFELLIFPYLGFAGVNCMT